MPAPRWFFRFVYDREAAAWGRRRDEEQHQALVESMADHLASVVAPPGPILDIGCGPGAHAVAMARRGYDVLGIDVSPRMVEVARARAERDGTEARFHVGDAAGALPSDDGVLAGVLAVHVIQHLPDAASFVGEVRRCLRPDGHLLLTAPSRSTGSLPPQRWYWRLRAAFYTYVPGVVRFTDEETLTTLLEAHGFDIVRTEADASRISVLARRDDEPNDPHPSPSTGAGLSTRRMGTELLYLRAEMPWHVEYPLETFIEVTPDFLVARRICRADRVLYNSTRASFAELGPMPLGFDRDLEDELHASQEMSRDAWREISRDEFDELWVESTRYVQEHFDRLGNRIAGEVDWKVD